MAAAAINPSTFHPFKRLPRELRDQIWRDALPDKVGPALSFYRKGNWCPRRLTESDKGYDPENDEKNGHFNIRYDLLDDIRFEIPLVYVNSEARDLAFAWVRKQGIEIRPGEGRQYPVFVRPFDPTRDALYVALDKWDDFVSEPYDQLHRPALLGRLTPTRINLTRLAVPVALLGSKANSLLELLELYEWFLGIRVLLIVLDPQPDLHAADNDVKVQHRWDFESTLGGSFFWNDDRGDFVPENSEYIVDEALDWLIKEACRGLGKWIITNHIEIRPVFATRR